MKVTVQLAPPPPAERKPLAAFAFDRSGNFLGTFAFDKDHALLDTKRNAIGRVFIAPRDLPLGKQPSIDQLVRRRAYEPAVKWGEARDVVQVLPVPEAYWAWWLYFCRVRGQVVRPVDFFGLHFTLPVCRARVHVCEVDPWIYVLPLLPDPDIFRLRDELLQQLLGPVVPRLPQPGPGPGPDPAPWLPQTGIGPGPRPGVEQALNPQPLPPRLGVAAAGPLAMTALRAVSAAPMAAQAAPALPAAAMIGLQSGSAALLRKTLVSQVDLLRPLLCGLPWLWRWFRCDEVAVIDTDDQGRFDTWILTPPRGDVPDLYFWVEYWINGSWQTVYSPPIACSTWWDYPCGTEVTLVVTDPRVPGCIPRPPVTDSLLIYGVGNLPLQHIQANGRAQGGNGDDYVPVAERPFAGSLLLQAEFPAKATLQSKGITHFLWSSRRVGEGEADWKPLTQAFSRGYRVDLPGDVHLSKQLPVQPDGSGLVPIPPDEPWFDLDGGVGGDWESYQFTTAVLDTTKLPSRTRVDEETGLPATDASGEFEFKLELFKGTTRVDFTAEGLGIQMQDVDHPLSGGVITWMPVELRNRYFGGTAHLQGFLVALATDNNACSASIDEARVGTTSAGPCGFIEYQSGDAVTLGYRMRHLTHNATFAFDIFRGSAGTIEYCRERSGVAFAVAHKAATEPAASSNYTRSAYHYQRTATVAEMLSSGCAQAAYGELLYAKAIATDGVQRAWWLDASAMPMAFALATQC